MRCILVSHTHWDREWYREFEAFRARLVDAIDRLLDLCGADPGYRFVLDGQTIALEDYAAIRPERAAELARCVGAGQVAIGPWYVQPDSLLPSGEAQVRNLLEGRRAGEAFGPVSRVAYTPDSFGHPGQLPQILAGFGLHAFVYWRGHGNERDALADEWDWEAPDGTRILACHLARGYFAAASDARDPIDAIAAAVAARLGEPATRGGSQVVLLLNGIDHAPPEARARALAGAIAREAGVPVERGLLEDFVAAVRASASERPRWRGDLLGARSAPLLPGVWSTRSWIKLANRRCEALLEGHAEPLAALAERYGGGGERAALRLAWRTLLPNHAHDSLCGCSADAVHEQMRGRFETVRGLAAETADRALRHLVGSPERRAPWSDEWDVAVWNPSPHPRSDVVRVALDPDPWLRPATDPADAVHPLLARAAPEPCYTADGTPARAVPAPAGRVTLAPDRPGFDLEILARDVPALGWTRVRVRRAAEPFAPAVAEVVPGSASARIEVEDRSVHVRDDGTLEVRFGPRVFSGLFALEDEGDRGDSYDFDPVAGPGDAEGARTQRVAVRRILHPGGFALLEVERALSLPARLAAGRTTRSRERCELLARLRVRLAPGVPRVDADLVVDDPAEDHRLRLLLPVGPGVASGQAAGTFDVCRRAQGAPDDTGWVQRAPSTFPCQGFVHAGGLCVVAPGLTEAELVTRDGVGAIAFTLLRCVGHLSRPDLRSRPGLAGPAIATPGAQCPGRFEARLALLPGLDPRAARDFELGLRAVACGARGVLPEGAPGLELSPSAVVLSALKPATDGNGVIARLLNPTDVVREATLRVGFPFARAALCALDERDAAPGAPALYRSGSTLTLPIGAHALCSLRLC